MAETLIIHGNSKEELYQNLLPQIKSIIEDEEIGRVSCRERVSLAV